MLDHRHSEKVRQLAEAVGLPIGDGDLEPLAELWSLYRYGLQQMGDELDQFPTEPWLGFEAEPTMGDGLWP